MWSWRGKSGEKRRDKIRIINDLTKELQDALRQNAVNVRLVEDLSATVEQQAKEIKELKEMRNMQDLKMRLLVDMWAMRFLDEEHDNVLNLSNKGWEQVS